MKAILKEIIFKSPLNFAYLIIVLLSSVLFAAVSEEGLSFAVLCWVCLYAINVSDRRQVMLELSLPLKKETIVDARYLIMFIVMLFETVIALWKGMRGGSWGLQGMMLFSLYISCGLWILGSIGIGGKNTGWFSLALFSGMLLAVLFGRKRIAPEIGMDGAFGLTAAGVGAYIAFWIASRRLIGRAEV